MHPLDVSGNLFAPMELPIYAAIFYLNPRCVNSSPTFFTNHNRTAGV